MRRRQRLAGGRRGVGMQEEERDARENGIGEVHIKILFVLCIVADG